MVTEVIGISLGRYVLKSLTFVGKGLKYFGNMHRSLCSKRFRGV